MEVVWGGDEVSLGVEMGEAEAVKGLFPIGIGVDFELVWLDSKELGGGGVPLLMVPKTLILSLTEGEFDSAMTWRAEILLLTNC